MIQMEESLPASPQAAPSDSHRFAVQCVEAIFAARTKLMAEGKQMFKGDLVKIIEQLDAARPRTAIPARLKRFDDPKAVKIPLSRLEPLRMAMAAAFGHVGKPGKQAGKQIGISISDIIETYPEVTPEEVSRWTKELRKKYEKIGPLGIASHWHECAKGPRTRVAEKSIYVEPPGWKDKLRVLAKERGFDPAVVEELLKTPWRDLSVTVREMLLK